MQVAKLIYTLNSDSDGDAGSDLTSSKSTGTPHQQCSTSSVQSVHLNAISLGVCGVDHVPPGADEEDPGSGPDAAQEGMEETMSTGRAGPHDRHGGSGSALDDDADGGPRASAGPSGGLEPQDSGPLGSDAELEVFAAETACAGLTRCRATPRMRGSQSEHVLALTRSRLPPPAGATAWPAQARVRSPLPINQAGSRAACGAGRCWRAATMRRVGVSGR